MEAMDGSHHTIYTSRGRRVVLNIRGDRFETFESTLEEFPETLLGSEDRRMKYFQPEMGEYYFDRDKFSFDAILFYYQSKGILARPETVSEDLFENELQFYDIQTVKDESPDKINRKADILPKPEWQRKVWLFFEKPESSTQAGWFAKMSVIVIIFSIISFCAETMDITSYTQSPPMPTRLKNTSGNSSLLNKEPQSKLKRPEAWFIIDTCITTWFCCEYFARLVSAPRKITFVFSTLALIDIIAILPYFISLHLDADYTHAITFTVLRIFRLLRVIRLLKLTRYIAALRILGYTIKSCHDQLSALMVLLLISIIMFSSTIYYLENDANPEEFCSIPASFWWCIITMTTVGYGDMCPKTPLGKLVGAFCAIFGVVVMVCLPTPVFILHFNDVYCRFLGIKMRDIGLAGSGRQGSSQSTTLKVVRTHEPRENDSDSSRLPLLNDA